MLDHNLKRECCLIEIIISHREIPYKGDKDNSKGQPREGRTDRPREPGISNWDPGEHEMIAPWRVIQKTPQPLMNLESENLGAELQMNRISK